jgi:HEAT repeat protein
MELPAYRDGLVARSSLATGLCLLIALATLDGCRTAPRSRESDYPLGPVAGEGAAHEPADDESAEDQEPALPEELVPLASDGWYEVRAFPEFARARDPAHWHHEDLDGLLISDRSSRPDLSSAMSHANPIVAANAALVMARWGATEAVEPLMAVIRNDALRVNLRCAALEALGLSPAVAAPDQLRTLANDLGEADSGSPHSESRNLLHAQWIRCLAGGYRPGDEKWLDLAAVSSVPAVRFEAALAWASLPQHKLPPAILALCHDPEDKVRGAALWTLAARNDPQAIRYLRKAMTESSVETRVAEIAALGLLASDESRGMLIEVLKGDVPILRAAAVRALASCGAHPLAESAWQDSDPGVRLAVAETLAGSISGDDGSPESSAVTAICLARDTNVRVQQGAVAAIADWPLSQAGPVLLSALAQGRHAAQLEAAYQLVDRWTASIDHASSDEHGECLAPLAVLKQRWAGQFKVLDDAAVDQAVDRLQSTSADERRQAAARLALRAAVSPLPPAMVARLPDVMCHQTAPWVWRGVMLSVSTDASPASTRLALSALANATADVRRAGCEYLAALGDPRYTAALVNAVRDSDPAVACAALRALGAVGALDDPRPVVDMLKSDQPIVRQEAALCLFRLRVPQGVAALERWTTSGEPAARLRAAQAMGETGDPRFLPPLMAMLSDTPSVRAEVLVSLAQVAGCDPGMDGQGQNAAEDDDEIARRWQVWYAEQRVQASAFGQP